MQPFVRYYTPAGGRPPAHAGRLTPMPLLDTAQGPDGTAGVVWGGAYEAGEAGWVDSGLGWWVHLGGCLPQHLLRFDEPPSVRRWVEVPGHLPEQIWRVPVLLRRRSLLYVCDLDPVFTPGGWQRPPELVDLSERLLRLATALAEHQDPDRDLQALCDLWHDLVGLSHRVSPVETAAGRWLTVKVLLRTILAAGSLGADEMPDEVRP